MSERRLATTASLPRRLAEAGEPGRVAHLREAATALASHANQGQAA